MTSARGPVQSAGEHADGERARRGAPQQPAVAGALPAGPALPPSAAAVLRLQRAFGNQAVQRVLPGAGAPAARPAPGGPRVQRWHDAEHDSSTQSGIANAGVGQPLSNIFGRPSGGRTDPRYDTATKVQTRLGDASVNMDRFAPQVTEGAAKESHNVGRLPTLAKFGASMTTSFLGHTMTQAGKGLGKIFSEEQAPAWKPGDFLPPRGIFGEGPDHAETGDYTLPVGQSTPGNVAQENHYIDESLKALDLRPVTADTVDEALNRLGDAAHVSADRGSHGEGAKGAGHDTPRPPEGHEGTTQMPYFMEGWEDNDSLQHNGGAAYQYGVARTAEMFQRFVGKAGLRGRPPAPQGPVPQPPRQNRPQQPLPQGLPGTGHQGGDQS